MEKTKWDISFLGWNGIAGVYCVCSKGKNNKTIIHYIGSSKNIGKRILSMQHPYRILCNNGIRCFIKYKETSDYLELERDLIYKIKPPMNIQNIGGLR